MGHFRNYIENSEKNYGPDIRNHYEDFEEEGSPMKKKYSNNNFFAHQKHKSEAVIKSKEV
jgi:hypothetical protein